MTPARHTGFAKLTQKDVSAAAARHEMLYSGRMGGARAVFAFCDLGGLDLSGRNLADADFTGAVMEETNFAGAKLDSASFFGSDLRRCNLSATRSQTPIRRTDVRFGGGGQRDGSRSVGTRAMTSKSNSGRFRMSWSHQTLTPPPAHG